MANTTIVCSTRISPEALAKLARLFPNTPTSTLVSSAVEAYANICHPDPISHVNALEEIASKQLSFNQARTRRDAARKLSEASTGIDPKSVFLPPVKQVGTVAVDMGELEERLLALKLEELNGVDEA